jgi:GxxExxY protein
MKLLKAGYFVEKEKALPLVYENIQLEIGYRIDLFIEHKLIVEIKSIDALADIHTAQILTYLKLSACRLGLLINFNVPLLKNGIKRLVL